MKTPTLTAANRAMKPKVVSLFAGIGGLDLGLERAGFEVVRQVEIDAYCLKVLEKHWPHTDRAKDIREEEPETYVERYGAINLVCGGFPCFPAGTLVLCKDGLKPIEDVRVGDEVLTHIGVFRRVVRTVSRFANTIVLKGYGHPELVTTENHPFYASERARTYNSHRRGWDSCFSEPTWVFAKDMKRKYWATPVSFPQMDLPPISSEGREFENPPITPDLMWLVGVWLGDGWVRMRKTKGRAIICASYDQADILRSAIRAAGFNASESKERTVIKFHITRRAFARWLVEHFGQKAHGKTIPTWSLGMSRELREALLMGYLFADGFPYKDGYKATTVSKPLAVGIKLLAQSLGWSVSLYRYQPNRTSVIEGRRVGERPQWQIVLRGETRSAFIKNGNVFGLVRSVSPTGRKELVYDITVESDHSFLADGIVVHNCQDLSVAGRRAGLVGERSGLFFELARIADAVPSAWVLAENVPGLLSSAGGADFTTVLGELSGFFPEVPEDGWRNSGVCTGPKGTVAWRVLDAQYFGVAQRRRRVFVVRSPSTARGSAFEVLFEPESLPGSPPPSRKEGERLAGTLTEGFGSRGVDAEQIANGNYAIDDLSMCLHGGFKGDTTHETYIATLGHTQSNGLGVYGQDVANTLEAVSSSNQAVVHCIKGAAIGRKPENGPQWGEVISDGTSYTLNATERHAVAVQEIRRPFKNQSQPAHSGHGVRRLTPTEAERLQGFPDGWTLLGDKTPDSPRYKACGNAVCVNVAEWIGKRIKAVMSKEVSP
jgi:DNA-cytosine methyltransferase